jgi:hypothetical protein
MKPERAQRHADGLDERHEEIGLGRHVRGAIQQHRGAQAEHRLPEILPARGQAARIADHELQVIVAEADDAEAHRDAERDPDEAIAQIGPQQRADHDGDDDQGAAHGGRAGLGQMRARPVVAHHLADLVARQARDHRGPTSSDMLSADMTARIARSVRYEKTWKPV